ncbi:helix-turn-helix domain-containing protein [Rhizocola hellebori]|uniref:helix-turn-helix domain-containing protein n=1 Tax=Rhizocola hellebori TaxID=1392758 RepID=UPI0035713FA4
MPNHLKPLTPEASARHRFGAEVRRHRLAAGMTMLRLAWHARLHRTIVSRIECATRYPSEAFATLCDELFKTGDHFARLYAALQAERPPDGRRRQ